MLNDWARRTAVALFAIFMGVACVGCDGADPSSGPADGESSGSDTGSSTEGSDTAE
jgi:hypothetical protein